ncbi:hypothetical protein BJ508DRAFT_334413 [Ascobolus immersus RN42]|uniref:Peptidase S33 tripeptidyl aminopeptidase-like C-terminal domain-containing protein n=1 Tax=Ascobolus immersus RN42 TaxID=1160509 RepID=A0A3N4HG49_ASCIM|nr:hypothetical protein BJ508DRAFT_334413 [Ascobolus immersus RN42]
MKLTFAPLVALGLMIITNGVLVDSQEAYPMDHAPNGNAVYFQFLPATEAIEWHGCLNPRLVSPQPEFKRRLKAAGLLCARLRVPLDYTNQTSERTANLLVMQKPAIVPRDSPKYLGRLFVHFGGPGASMVETFLSQAEQFHLATDGLYDIVVVEPRGHFYSSPESNCFGSVKERLLVHSFFNKFAPSAQSGGASSFAERLSRDKAYAAKCSLKLGSAAGTMRYLGSVAVARDYERINQRIADALGEQDPRHASFWTFSYGTLLAQTYATLFPEKTGRMILDAVYFPHQDNVLESTNQTLLDFDEGLASFYMKCWCLRRLCPLYEESVSATLAAIKKRAEDIFKKIETDGAVYDLTDMRHMNYHHFALSMLDFLRNPQTRNDVLLMALKLLEIERGGQISLFKVFHRTAISTVDIGKLHNEETNLGAPFGKATDVSRLVRCGDLTDTAMDQLDSAHDLMRGFDKLAGMSRLGAEAYVDMLTECAGFPVGERSVERLPVLGANLRTPMLVVRSTEDPTTPYSSAEKAADRFPGSILQKSETPGHTSTSPNASNDCVRSLVHRFLTGDPLTIAKRPITCYGHKVSFTANPSAEVAIDISPSRTHNIGNPAKRNEHSKEAALTAISKGLSDSELAVLKDFLLKNTLNLDEPWTEAQRREVWNINSGIGTIGHLVGMQWRLFCSDW